MIQIHRAKRVMKIGRRSVPLTPDEHRLITALAMMNNKVIPRDLLMDVIFDHPVRIPADATILAEKVRRLKKKIGGDVVRVKKHIGYELTGEVEFIG